MALKRLQKELQMVTKEADGGFTASPSGEDMFHWKASIVGPKGTPYEGGTFFLEITFPADYPFQPPKIIYTTKVYHPNVNEKGEICLDILKTNWSTSLTIGNVLQSVINLLIDPNPDDPLAPEVAELYKTNRAQFEKTAKEWTKKYGN